MASLIFQKLLDLQDAHRAALIECAAHTEDPSDSARYKRKQETGKALIDGIRQAANEIAAHKPCNVYPCYICGNPSTGYAPIEGAE